MCYIEWLRLRLGKLVVDQIFEIINQDYRDQLNQEYHESYFEDHQNPFHMLFLRHKKKTHIILNYRHLRAIIPYVMESDIFNQKGQKVGKLPSNYYRAKIVKELRRSTSI